MRLSRIEFEFDKQASAKRGEEIVLEMKNPPAVGGG